MNKNQRHNRPRKKEVPQEKWDEQFNNLKNQFEHDGKNRKVNKEPDEQPSEANK
jgi:hypothetical protein